jgi:hypothetical protein
MTFKIMLADLGLRKLTAADIWWIRKELQHLYKRSDQVDPFKDKKSENEFAEIAMDIKYLRKVLYCHYYMHMEKEPAPSPKVKADSF